MAHILFTMYYFYKNETTPHSFKDRKPAKLQYPFGDKEMLNLKHWSKG